MATRAEVVFTQLPMAPPFAGVPAGLASDGVAVADGMPVLVWTTSPYDGVWVAGAGTWARHANLDASGDFVWGAEDTIVRVRGGSRYFGSEFYYNGADNPTLGSDTLYFNHARYGIAEAPEDPEEDEDDGARGGLRVVWDGAAALTVEAGFAHVPRSSADTGGVFRLEDEVNMTGLVLAANSWYYLYCYESGGKLLVDPPSLQRPASPYFGSARVKGGGVGGALDNADPDTQPDETRRYVGAVRCTATANTLLPFVHRGDWVYYHGVDHALTTAGALGTEILSGGAGTAFTVRDAGPVVPPTSDVADFLFNTNGSSGVEANADLTNATSKPFLAAKSGASSSMVLPTNASQQIYTRNAASGGATDIAVRGFLMER